MQQNWTGTSKCSLLSRPVPYIKMSQNALLPVIILATFSFGPQVSHFDLLPMFLCARTAEMSGCVAGEVSNQPRHRASPARGPSVQASAAALSFGGCSSTKSGAGVREEGVVGQKVQQPVSAQQSPTAELAWQITWLGRMTLSCPLS